MARQVVVQVFCDLCESTEGAGPLEFAIDRSAFEIDLCAEHRGAFNTALAPFVSNGRTARSRATASATAAAPAHRRVVRRDPAQTEAIRRWAKDNGFAISGRGRIPGSVEAAYNARGTN